MLSERRLMMVEDCKAMVIRELEEAWKEEFRELTEKHNEELHSVMTITKEVHEKQIKDYTQRLHSELRGAQEAVEEKKERENRKRGGFFAFLSPNSKKKRDELDAGDDSPE